MFIMGDVLAVVAGIVGIGATLWAAIVVFAVLFPARVKRAALLAEQEWRKSLLWGAGVAFAAGGFGLILANQPNGLLRFVGWVLLLGLLAVAVLGAAGLADLTAKRVLRLNPGHSQLGATGRGAALLVAAGFLPILGWFAFFPVQALLALGAGARALLHRARVAAPAAQTVKESVVSAG